MNASRINGMRASNVVKDGRNRDKKINLEAVDVEDSGRLIGLCQPS
jgi:hypothetical protein